MQALQEVIDLTTGILTKKEVNNLYNRLQANPNITENMPKGVANILLWLDSPQFISGRVPLSDFQRALFTLKIPEDLSKALWECDDAKSFLHIFINMTWLANMQKILIINAIIIMLEILSATDKFNDRDLAEFFNFNYKDNKQAQDAVNEILLPDISYKLEVSGWSTIPSEYFVPDGCLPDMSPEAINEQNRKRQIENLSKELYLTGFCDRFAEQLIKHNIVVDKNFLHSLNVNLSVTKIGEGKNNKIIIKANYFN